MYGFLFGLENLSNSGGIRGGGIISIGVKFCIFIKVIEFDDNSLM